MAKYLVTGGAGFIGSRLATRLLAEGHAVWIVDNLTTGYRQNIPPDAAFLQLDLSQPSSFRELPDETVDAVLHLAAQSSGEISFEDTVYDLQTNMLGTLLLLRWCVERRISRFLYASSMSIYGDVAEQPVVETAACRPKSFYGIGKLTAEQYLRIFADHGINSTAFRMFNVYGPGQNLANMKQGMVSIYLAYMLRGEPLIVRGSKDRFRDFIHVDDVVEAWLTAIDNPTSFGKTYNLGTGKPSFVWQLIEELSAAFGGDFDKPVEFVEGTPGDQFGMYADIGLIGRELGWKPQTELRSGIQRTVDWARRQAEGAL